MPAKLGKISKFLKDNATLLYLSLTKLTIHFSVNLSGGYGFFRDEFYYIACSDHLAWGYVDQPPLSILLLKISRLIFGDSLFFIRLLPALAGAAAVFVTGLLVKKLGGGRFSQILAGVSVIVAPYYLAINGFFSMNSFDMLFWILTAYIIVLIIKKDNSGLWLWLGLIVGLGLMNKISMLWLVLGFAVGLVFSALRKSLRSPRSWITGFVSLGIFLPYIIWQMFHDWATLEFIKNATSQKMAAVSLMDFLISQIFSMHPLTLPIWLLGLFYYFFQKQGKQFRILGIIFITVFLLLIINQKSRPGYLGPAFCMLFASGSLLIENILNKLKWRWIKYFALVIIVLAGIITAPLALPVLPVENYITYASLLGQKPSTQELKEVGKLPQFYADMYGWDSMVKIIAGVYQKLSPEEQSECVIFAGNYGEASAIDFLGKKYNLPGAISGHNNYWLWGPGDKSAEVIIFFGGPSEERLEGLFKYVEKAATFTCQYCMPYENNTPVYLCKDPRINIKNIWSRFKHYE